ncbi:hypothetical protein [Pseudohalioglobus lutimaris]|uniref:Outer membrane protein beta-barrel domain-containing protein n=1 Tax=Pseudohalioglobus lutimaris TaxID=1737061 RepID=A0A2N5WX67_9GAMM|nr:hypothetical protein [Pseudohalioglobus lutimaris]PLW66834.1 hypothetical protein C0039_19850 [Pseudohalioglobus lutimaris]
MKTSNVWIIAAGAAASMMLGANTAKAEDGEWEFSVAPFYLWAKGIEGNSSAGGRELPLALDFKDDILENLDAAFAIHFEARKDRLTLFAEYNYAKLDPGSTATAGPVTLKADVEFKDIMAEAGLTWAVAESATLRWEILGGLRYYKQDLDIKLKSDREGGQLLPESASVGDRWLHPFAGGRVIADLGERWTFRARADYGYEGSDNTALQGIATLDYRFSDWGSAFFGYRYYEMDFDNGASRRDQYGFDGNQQGPLLGVNLYF